MFNGSRTTWPATIRMLRAELGATQEQLPANLGVAFSTVSRREDGRGNPAPLAMKRLEQPCRVQRQDSYHRTNGPS